jgi:HSP20 family molecular chaperone IbpA
MVEGKRMQEQVQQQHSPVKLYRTAERLMIAAPMAGLEPENMLVEVTHAGRLMLHGEQRAMLKEVKATLAILRPAFKHDCTSTFRYLWKRASRAGARITLHRRRS